VGIIVPQYKTWPQNRIMKSYLYISDVTRTSKCKIKIEESQQQLRKTKEHFEIATMQPK
jgi:hypothetical protein